MEFKNLWDLESALQVLVNKSVDAKLWAEAVEWLLHYGPSEIRQLLLDASEIATGTVFPALKPSHYTADGQPYYEIQSLAEALGLTKEQAREILHRKEQEKDERHIDTIDADVTMH